MCEVAQPTFEARHKSGATGTGFAVEGSIISNKILTPKNLYKKKNICTDKKNVYRKIVK